MPTAVGFAISVILVKSLTRTDSVVAIIFWMLVVQSVLGVVPALLVWQWPSWTGVVLDLVVAFCGTFSHYCMARAMRPRRRDRRRADGFPAGSVDGRRRLG